MKTAYPNKYSQYVMAVSLFFRHGHAYLSHSGKMMCFSLCRAMEDIEYEEWRENTDGSV